MQNVTDVYPPFWISWWRLAAVIAVIVLIVGGRVVIKHVLRYMALQSQRRLTQQAQTKDPHVLDNALAQLTSLHDAYMRRELSADSAAEQASLLVREVYDNVMNHQTRFQARYEIAARRLERVEQLVAKTYPVEFAKTTGQVTDAAVLEVFTKAKEVIESCR